MIDIMKGHILSGRYRIIQEIGRGAFGVTFLAEDIQRPGNPQCVVKQFQPMAADPETFKAGKILFEREAVTLEKLGNHQQIPRLLAHFEENQQFYLVQEYIEGYDIKEEVYSGQQLSEKVVIKLLEEILEVLNFVHQQKVIHRDIKPSNIRRRQSDRKIVLIDFGAVKEIGTQIINKQGEIKPTVAIGTLGYMPSEQANGHPDFSSDVYAVGMIGIQALTGIFPMNLEKNQNSELAWRHLVEVSPKFADVLDKMVRYDFRQRYSNAELALQALKKVVNKSNLFPRDTIQKVTPKFLLLSAVGTGILGLGIALFSIFNYPEKELIKFTNYENSKLGITINYPQNWQRQDIDNVFTQEVVTFLSPRQSETDKFQEKLTISVQNYSGTLNSSKADFEKEVINSLQEGNIINSGATTIAYKTGYQIVFTGKYEGQDLNVKNLKAWTLKNNKAYIMIYSAQDKEYDNFLQTAQEMIKSFEFMNE